MSPAESIRFEDLGDGRMAACGQCLKCRTPQRLVMWDSQFLDWWFGEEIQSVMPEVSDDDREWLVSGICGGCFDAIWEERTA